MATVLSAVLEPRLTLGGAEQLTDAKPPAKSNAVAFYLSKAFYVSVVVVFKKCTAEKPTFHNGFPQLGFPVAITHAPKRLRVDNFSIYDVVPPSYLPALHKVKESV